jgi:cell division protein FtsB
MKWEDLEKRFGDYVNSVENAPPLADTDSLHDSGIWSEIKSRLTPSRKIISYRMAAASAIGAIIISGIFLIIVVAQKNREIARLNSELNDLKNSENVLASQIRQMQYNLDIVQNKVPETITVESKTDKISIDSTSSPVHKPLVTPVATESTDEIPIRETIFSKIIMAEIKEPVLSDPIKSDKLSLANLAMATSDQPETIKKGLVHYKIDYGEVKNGTETPQRPWKVTITYQ